MCLYRIVVLISLLFATQVNAGDGLITQKSNNSVDVTIDRLEAILTKKGMTIFARVNHAVGAKKVKLELRPTQLLIFGNPKVGTMMMQSNQAAGIDLPMKALAWEDESGQVWLTYNAAGYLSERHHIQDRGKVVEKMTNALQKFSSYAVTSQE